MKLTFTTVDLSKILNKNQRFTISWVEIGIFIADLQPAAGYASRREFSYAGVLRAYLAVHLQNRYGFKRDKLRNLVESLWGHGFFQAWGEGYPKDIPCLNLIEGLSLAFEKPSLDGGGCLMIMDLYKEGSTKVIWWPGSVVDTLRAWNEVDVVKAFSGVSDCLILNLADLKREVDERIHRVKG
jgi:hypothetical protein